MTAKTPVFQLEYIVEGEPARNARGALERNAKSIEAALLQGPASPPGAQDLLQVSGRVTALEPPLAWTEVALAAPWTSYLGAAGEGPYGKFAVRFDPSARRIWMRGWVTTPSATAAGALLVPVGGVPVAVRPPANRTVHGFFNPAGEGRLQRFEVKTDGSITSSHAIAANGYVNFDMSSWALS